MTAKHHEPCLGTKPVVIQFVLGVALSGAACGSEDSWAFASAGGGPVPTPTNGSCSAEVTAAVREHVNSQTACYSGAIRESSGRLVAESGEPNSGMLSCATQTVDPWNAAQKIAQASLVDVPPPDCELSLTIAGGGLATEQKTLWRIVAACRTGPMAACQSASVYPSVKLVLDAVGRVVDAQVALPDGVCGTAGTGGFGGAGGIGGIGGIGGVRAGTPLMAKDLAAIANCIEQTVVGQVFPCHAGATLCSQDPGDPI